MVVQSIDIKREPVGIRVIIPPRKTCHDLAWLAIVKPHADVERRVVVKDTNLRALRRSLTFLRFELTEVARKLCQSPRRFNEPSIDRDRSLRAVGAQRRWC